MEAGPDVDNVVRDLLINLVDEAVQNSDSGLKRVQGFGDATDIQEEECINSKNNSCPKNHSPASSPAKDDSKIATDVAANLHDLQVNYSSPSNISEPDSSSKAKKGKCNEGSVTKIDAASSDDIVAKKKSSSKLLETANISDQHEKAHMKKKSKAKCNEVWKQIELSEKQLSDEAMTISKETILSTTLEILSELQKEQCNDINDEARSAFSNDSNSFEVDKVNSDLFKSEQQRTEEQIEIEKNLADACREEEEGESKSESKGGETDFVVVPGRQWEKDEARILSVDERMYVIYPKKETQEPTKASELEELDESLEQYRKEQYLNEQEMIKTSLCKLKANVEKKRKAVCVDKQPYIIHPRQRGSKGTKSFTLEENIAFRKRPSDKNLQANQTVVGSKSDTLNKKVEDIESGQDLISTQGFALPSLEDKCQSENVKESGQQLQVTPNFLGWSSPTQEDNSLGENGKKSEQELNATHDFLDLSSATQEDKPLSQNARNSEQELHATQDFLDLSSPTPEDEILYDRNFRKLPDITFHSGIERQGNGSEENGEILSIMEELYVVHPKRNSSEKLAAVNNRNNQFSDHRTTTSITLLEEKSKKSCNEQFERGEVSNSSNGKTVSSIVRPKQGTSFVDYGSSQSLLNHLESHEEITLDDDGITEIFGSSSGTSPNNELKDENERYQIIHYGHDNVIINVVSEGEHAKSEDKIANWDRNNAVNQADATRIHARESPAEVNKASTQSFNQVNKESPVLDVNGNISSEFDHSTKQVYDLGVSCTDILQNIYEKCDHQHFNSPVTTSNEECSNRHKEEEKVVSDASKEGVVASETNGSSFDITMNENKDETNSKKEGTENYQCLRYYKNNADILCSDMLSAQLEQLNGIPEASKTESKHNLLCQHQLHQLYGNRPQSPLAMTPHTGSNDILKHQAEQLYGNSGNQFLEKVSYWDACDNFNLIKAHETLKNILKFQIDQLNGIAPDAHFDKATQKQADHIFDFLAKLFLYNGVRRQVEQLYGAQPKDEEQEDREQRKKNPDLYDLKLYFKKKIGLKLTSSPYADVLNLFFDGLMTCSHGKDNMQKQSDTKGMSDMVEVGKKREGDDVTKVTSTNDDEVKEEKKEPQACKDKDLHFGYDGGFDLLIPMISHLKPSSFSNLIKAASEEHQHILPNELLLNHNSQHLQRNLFTEDAVQDKFIDESDAEFDKVQENFKRNSQKQQTQAAENSALPDCKSMTEQEEPLLAQALSNLRIHKQSRFYYDYLEGLNTFIYVQDTQSLGDLSNQVINTSDKTSKTSKNSSELQDSSQTDNLVENDVRNLYGMPSDKSFTESFEDIAQTELSDKETISSEELLSGRKTSVKEYYVDKFGTVRKILKLRKTESFKDKVENACGEIMPKKNESSGVDLNRFINDDDKFSDVDQQPIENICQNELLEKEIKHTNDSEKIAFNNQPFGFVEAVSFERSADSSETSVLTNGGEALPEESCNTTALLDHSHLGDEYKDHSHLVDDYKDHSHLVDDYKDHSHLVDDYKDELKMDKEKLSDYYRLTPRDVFDNEQLLELAGTHNTDGEEEVYFKKERLLTDLDVSHVSTITEKEYTLYSSDSEWSQMDEESKVVYNKGTHPMDICEQYNQAIPLENKMSEVNIEEFGDTGTFGNQVIDNDYQQTNFYFTTINMTCNKCGTDINSDHIAHPNDIKTELGENGDLHKYIDLANITCVRKPLQKVDSDFLQETLQYNELPEYISPQVAELGEAPLIDLMPGDAACYEQDIEIQPDFTTLDNPTETFLKVLEDVDAIQFDLAQTQHSEPEQKEDEDKQLDKEDATGRMELGDDNMIKSEADKTNGSMGLVDDNLIKSEAAETNGSMGLVDDNLIKSEVDEITESMELSDDNLIKSEADEITESMELSDDNLIKSEADKATGRMELSDDNLIKSGADEAIAKVQKESDVQKDKHSDVVSVEALNKKSSGNCSYGNMVNIVIPIAPGENRSRATRFQSGQFVRLPSVTALRNDESQNLKSTVGLEEEQVQIFLNNDDSLMAKAEVVLQSKEVSPLAENLYSEQRCVKYRTFDPYTDVEAIFPPAEPKKKNKLKKLFSKKKKEDHDHSELETSPKKKEKKFPLRLLRSSKH